MQSPPERFQPHSYHRFQCIGADCEDTCCVGWIVQVDKSTYESYQTCDNSVLGPRLRELVTINTTPSSANSYARIALSPSGCPFLSDGLCSIQTTLGESYLSVMCSTYPRLMNIMDDVLQRSLDLSCPEAARVVLLNPEPMSFDSDPGTGRDQRIGDVSTLRTAGTNSAKPYPHFREIRDFVIWLLQYREYPLWKRLAILASFCDELHNMAAAGQNENVPGLLDACRDAVRQDLFGPSLAATRSRPAAQLEIVVEGIVARITSDFTPPRFLSCYQEFMRGLEWTAQSGMEELGQRYSAGYEQYLVPFLNRYEYIFENYLVTYVFQTFFPLGPSSSGRQLNAHLVNGTIREQCLFLLAHYGIVQALMIGLARLHKHELSTGHAITVIQSCTKTFEHSVAFPKRVLDILASAGIDSCVKLALLIRN